MAKSAGKNSIGRKIILGYLLLLVAMGAVGFFGYGAAQRASQAASQVVNERLPALQTAQNLEKAILQQESGLRGLLATGNASYIDLYNQGRELGEKSLEALAASAETEAEKGWLEQAKKDLEVFHFLVEQLFSQASEGDLEVARARVGQGDVFLASAKEQVENIVKQHTADIKAAEARARGTVRAGGRLVVEITVAALIGVFIFAMLITRVIVRPIRELLKQARIIAGGDLTQSVTLTNRDEIGMLGAAFNSMAAGMREMVKNIAEKALQVAAASQELSTAMNQTGQATEQVSRTVGDLAKGAEAQAEGMGKVSAKIHEMAESVKQVSQNAVSVEEFSTRSAVIADEGKITVEQTRRQMDSIKNSAGQTAEIVKGLGVKSQQIGQIVDAITSIADQTNLLALNAAIEAARAGEQGRGFAVVADEVRKLAEQSREAAGQIAGLVGLIRAETARVVASVDVEGREVAIGAGAVQRAAEAFDAISEAVAGIVHQIAEISSATYQMDSMGNVAVGLVEEVSRVVEGTASSTQEAAAVTQQQNSVVAQMASSAEALSRLAEDLNKAISRFKY
ncbi:MAG: methyl-accepting chemotaxis protein [Firmicutes bacterium]|nr:methyl-accepting chemotaxis protein [Bacillota bacterium]